MSPTAARCARRPRSRSPRRRARDRKRIRPPWPCAPGWRQGPPPGRRVRSGRPAGQESRAVRTPGRSHSRPPARPPAPAARRCRAPVRQPAAGAARSRRCCCPERRRHWRPGRLLDRLPPARRIPSSHHVPLRGPASSALIPVRPSATTGVINETAIALTGGYLGDVMTDVGRMQAGTVDSAPGPPRTQIQVVPLKGLPIVAVVVAFVIAAIAGNWLWALVFCHVVGGGLWTAIDLFVGLIIGPILGRLPAQARAEFAARVMPKMVLLLPTL